MQSPVVINHVKSQVNLFNASISMRILTRRAPSTLRRGCCTSPRAHDASRHAKLQVARNHSNVDPQPGIKNEKKSPGKKHGYKQ